jgi:cytoskeletal protein CcmA (bactofilin family)
MSSSDYNRIVSTVNSVSSNFSFVPDLNNVIVIDTSNNRIGINNTNPEYSLDISGNVENKHLGIITPNLTICGGYVHSSLIPNNNYQYDLGNISKPWNSIHCSSGNFQNIDLSINNFINTEFFLINNQPLIGFSNNLIHIGYDFSLNIKGSNLSTHDIHLTGGTISSNSTIILDPSGIGDDTGTVIIKGDLNVLGTQTIITSQTLEVSDNIITINKGNTNQNDDAGIEIDRTSNNNQRLIWSNIDEKWKFIEENTNNLQNIQAKDLSVHNVQANDLNVNGDSVFYQNVDITGILEVDGDTSLNSNVDITGILEVDGNTSLKSNVDITGILEVDGDTSLNSNVDITGILEVDGDTTLNSKLIVQDDTTLNSKLIVEDDTTLKSNVDITGILEVSERADIGDRLTCVGVASFVDDEFIFQNGVSNLGDTLYIDNVNNRVGINKAVPEEDFDVDGNIQINTSGLGRLVFYDSNDDHEHAEVDADDDGTNGGQLIIKTKENGGSVTQKLNINNAGAIGIGATPSYGTAGSLLTSNSSTALPSWSSTVNINSLTVNGTSTFTDDVTIVSMKLGTLGTSPSFVLAHKDHFNNTNHALLQNSSADTVLNAGSGRKLHFRVGNNITDQIYYHSNGFFMGTGNNRIEWKNGDYNAYIMSTHVYGLGQTINMYLHNNLRFQIGPNQVTCTYTFRPGNDNMYSLGSTSNRWKKVYAASSSISTSDDRLKINETPINNSLGFIRNIDFYEYDKVHTVDGNDIDHRERGVVAQHLLGTDLEYMLEGGQEEDIEDTSGNITRQYVPYGIRYNDIFVTNCKATKELDILVQSQQTEINDLKQENSLIKSKLNEILSEMGKETI